MIDGTTPTRILLNPPLSELLNPVAVYRSAAHPTDTDTIGILGALDALLTLPPTYNDLTIQATGHSHGNARLFLERASRIMVVPMPEFIPDGEGGIDIEWEQQGRRLALSCRAQPEETDFLSWREGAGRYDGSEATQDLLNERLDWLTR